MKYSELAVASQDDAPKPRRIASVPKHLFCDDWPDKPEGDEALVGLKLPAMQDFTDACASADEYASTLHPDNEAQRGHAWRDQVMALVVARATTDPLDARKPWLDAAEDNITLALRPEGIERLWQELEELRFEHAALLPEASDEDVGELAELLARGPALLALLDRSSARGVRRRLHVVLEELRRVSLLATGLSAIARAKAAATTPDDDLFTIEPHTPQ